MPINTNSIAPMPESHSRLAIKTESLYGTEETPDAGDAIRIIEPNMSASKGDEVKFNESWDSRVDAETTKRHRLHRTFAHKAYFYIPRTNTEVVNVIGYLRKLLLPAHMKHVEGASQTFTIDNDFLTGGAIKRTGVTLAYQEYVQQEKIIGARNNFKLNFSTAGGMLIELDWLGIDGGTPTNPGTAFAKPPHVGAIINYASANYFIRPLAEQIADPNPTDVPYLFCKAFTFDYGNQPTLLDDCNEPDGISGVHIGNILDGQKVTFDVTMPATHGSELSANTFPWQKYYKEATLMYWEQTIYGSTETGQEKGIKLSGVFQITDDPSRSKADGFRRISIGGASKTDISGTYEPFKIEVINNND